MVTLNLNPLLKNFCDRPIKLIAILGLLQCALLVLFLPNTGASLADRSRIVKARVSDGRYDRHRDNGRPIEGSGYRVSRHRDVVDSVKDRRTRENQRQSESETNVNNLRGSDTATASGNEQEKKKPTFETSVASPQDTERNLGQQFTGCCSNYKSYYALDLCEAYGEDCENGEGGSNNSGDEDCSGDGLSFIGISFSVNTASGNPYSYQLCDQFPMEGIIDRDYENVMSMDEDGWLVGGGYKSFDYSGKMPYIDSSHTELIRIGNMDPDVGGTSIDQVYEAMSSITFSPIRIFPEYLKGGGGHNSGDDDGGSVPSSDVTFIVSIVEQYDDDAAYSYYEQFLDDLFSSLYYVGGGPCMDDHDTDPHVSMSRGVKYRSSAHATAYMYAANLEVAVWQAMYPYGVVIGANGYASFPPGKNSGSKQYVGYGNLYFFFDRANITQQFAPNRDLTDDESYYATLHTDIYDTDALAYFYSSTTTIDFDYGGSGSGDDDESWEHNPYSWKASNAMHDMTDGWDLPPNCYQEGETFLGIPLARKSGSQMQSTSTFQNQFDFDYITDKNYTYVGSFGTNHGWLTGEEVGNAIGSIVDKDTAHIPLFYTGTTNADMGGIGLSNIIKIMKNIEFGTLYIKPAFVFIDGDGHLKLQFEADSNSALGYLYDTLCKELGISWNYASPSNTLGVYTNCAMHAAGDRANYGCGPENGNGGGFCPQMTIAYEPKFHGEEYAATFLANCNNYVDYWRSLYPTGVAVGTDNFCPNGGCLGLYLNRYDLYSVFKPDLGGSWVEYNGASMAPTYSPAPTWSGGCNEPHNFHLDKCFQRKKRIHSSTMIWDSLGYVGQFSVLLVGFMSVTLLFSLFVARARKKRKNGESYLRFFIRDAFSRKRKKKSKKSLRRRLKGLDDELEESILGENKSRRSKKTRSSSRSGKSRSRSRAGTRSKSRSGRVPKSDRSRVSRNNILVPKIVSPSTDGERSGKNRRSNGSRSRSRSKMQS